MGRGVKSFFSDSNKKIGTEIYRQLKMCIRSVRYMYIYITVYRFTICLIYYIHQKYSARAFEREIV